MDTRKTKFVVAFGLVFALVVAAVPRMVAASSNSTIYSFGTTQPIDGGVPKGSLTYVNGLLFGRTTTTIATMPTPASTPVGSYGVIFHFDPNDVASSYSIDHVFAGHDTDDGDNPRHDAMTPFNGLLYGTTLDAGSHNNGIIFSFRLCIIDRQEPHGRLTLDPDGTTLYGMTRKGGAHDYGIVFKVDTSGNNYTVLHDFTGGHSDGDKRSWLRCAVG